MVRTLRVLRRCPLELGLLETKVASQLHFKNNIHLIMVKHTSVLFHTFVVPYCVVPYHVVPYCVVPYCFIQSDTGSFCSE